jgi:hypothetical protein
LDKPRRPFPKPKPLLEAHLGVVEVQSVWVGYLSFRQGAYWLIVEKKHKARLQLRRNNKVACSPSNYNTGTPNNLDWDFEPSVRPMFPATGKLTRGIL